MIASITQLREKGLLPMAHYYEQRKRATNNHRNNQEAVTADIMRHFHARQFLGSAMVITDQPYNTFTSCKRQWMKLSRLVQKRRASTIDADKILRHTHTIAHMQQVVFDYSRTSSPSSLPAVYFSLPNDTIEIPRDCMSVYVMAQISSNVLSSIIATSP
jgi:hypothetical protein